MKYFKVGAYLNEIWIIINNDDDILNRPNRNKVTGIIKGSGIAKSHVDIFGKYGNSESKRARDAQIIKFIAIKEKLSSY